MAQKGSQVEKVGETAKEAAREAAPWVERFARFGYAARGVVYVTIGLLAERTAFRRTSEQPDSDSALRAIVIQPFGRFLVALLAAGLIGYVLWRLVQAVVDPEQQCKGGQRLFTANRLCIRRTHPCRYCLKRHSAAYGITDQRSEWRPKKLDS